MSLDILPVCPCAFQLIVSTDQAKAGMIAETEDIVFCFNCNILCKLRCYVVNVAGVHQIFPKENSVFIAESVEFVGWIISAAPYAKTVKVCKYAGIYIALQDFPGNSWVEAVIRNIICTSGKNLYAIYHNGKFLAPLVILTGYRDSAETDGVFPGIKNSLAGFQLDRQGV